MKTVNWIDYALAWSKYAGEILVRVGNLGAVIRETFTSVKKPDINDFTK